MPLLAVAAGAYAVLAVRVSRSFSDQANGHIAVFMLLISGMLVGSAFSYTASSAAAYGVGRIFSFISAGFTPVVFYALYRQYTIGSARTSTVLLLSLVPLVSVFLAVSNSLHGMIWTAEMTDGGLVTSALIDHAWYRYVYAPFTYGLLTFSMVALVVRIQDIPPAQRRVVTAMLACAAVPILVSAGNNFFGFFGSPDFPATSLTLALEFPILAFASLALRVHEFNPIAYQTLFDHVRDPIFVLDNEQRIVTANRAGEKLLGGEGSQIVGRKLWEEFPAARRILAQARELDLTQTLKMDTQNIYEVSVGPLSDNRGADQGMVVVCRDVTERRRAQSKLADSEHLVRTLVETSSNGILRFARDENDANRRFRCVFANRAAEEFAGGGEGALVGMPLAKLEHIDPQRLTEHFGGDQTSTSQLCFEVGGGGDAGERWLRIICEPVGDDFSVTLIDITQRKRKEKKMLADAIHDPLTGLLNRRGFEGKGKTALAECETGAVLYLDLNHFKEINDQFGHQAGDALLKAFGHRLGFCLRPEDILGRLGGDEFAIILPDVSLDDVRHIADRLIQSASEAYIIQGREIKCTASVGIALMPKHGDDLWQLLGVADAAMYETKRIEPAEAANDRAAYISAATAS